MKTIRRILVFLLILCFYVACNTEYSYKKKGYFKLDLPADHNYQIFDRPEYPYSFEYPVYANVVKDSTYFDTKPENDYWVNLDFPRNNARIFISYKVIGGEAYYKTKQPDGTYKDSTGVNRFELLVRDAYKLTNKNDVQATSIADDPILTSNGISGIYFRVGGNAATSRQFFLSDSVRHFIRGALYFDCTPNADSLQPAIDFYEKDILHLINTFKWKNQSTP